DPRLASGGATGSIANTATVTAPGTATDPNGNNNSVTDTDTIATPGTTSLAINAGGGASGAFVADTGFTGRQDVRHDRRDQHREGSPAAFVTLQPDAVFAALVPWRPA